MDHFIVRTAIKCAMFQGQDKSPPSGLLLQNNCHHMVITYTVIKPILVILLGFRTNVLWLEVYFQGQKDSLFFIPHSTGSWTEKGKFEHESELSYFPANSLTTSAVFSFSWKTEFKELVLHLSSSSSSSSCPGTWNSVL